MAVTLDANSSAATASGVVTTVDHTNLTIGSGDALIVKLAFQGQVTGVSVVWDQGGANQACSLIVSQNDPSTVQMTQLWGLVAPVSGNKTLRVSWTTATRVGINALSFSGVDQTGGATSFPNSTGANGTSTAPSVTITSATGNMTVDCLSSSGTIKSAPSQTQDFNNLRGAGSYANGAASNVHSWTLDFSSDWASAGCDILAFAPVPFVAQLAGLVNTGIVGLNHWRT